MPNWKLVDAPGQIRKYEEKDMAEQRLIDANELIPLIKMGECNMYDEYCQGRNGGIAYAIERINQMPTIEPEQHWIPCSERLPDGAYPVIVTWKNIDPASYYQYILGKHYVGVAHYKNGKWYWYSSVTEDVLMEYGRYDSEEFDEAIECMAWMPLPEPWEGEQHD